MKKLSVLLAFILVLGVSFASCSKDDDNTVEPTIEGKWNYTSASLSANGLELPYDAFIDNKSGCNKNYIELKTAGVAIAGEYAEDCKLTAEAGTWMKAGKILTFKSNEENISFEIVSVTDSTLKLKISAEEAGIPVAIIITLVKA